MSAATSDPIVTMAVDAAVAEAAGLAAAVRMIEPLVAGTDPAPWIAAMADAAVARGWAEDGDAATSEVMAALAFYARKPVQAAADPVPAVHEPVQEVKQRSGGNGLSPGVKHRIRVQALDNVIEQLDLVIDATGNFRNREDWTRSRWTLDKIAERAAFEIRTKIDVAVDVLVQTLSVRVDREAAIRRQAIISRITGRPATAAGDAELRRLVRAMTGQERPADVEALRHVIWLIKRKAAGLPAEAHLMLVLYGKQGAGKSVAMLKLLAPLAELIDPDMTVDSLCDDRWAPMLADLLVGFLDELSGMTRADFARLKARVTSPVVSYRPMRTNRVVSIPHNCTFVGATNKPVAELLKDETGNRRFYEIHTLDRLDWNEINAIDYNEVWNAVSETDAAPAVVHRGIISAVQLTQRYRDGVERFSSEVIIERAGVAYIVADGLFKQYQEWCAANGERPQTAEQFGQRLRALGWRRIRPRVSGKPTYAYAPPSSDPSDPSDPSDQLL